MRHDIVSLQKWLRAAVVWAVGSVAACMTASHVLVGQTRAPVLPGEVDVYFEPVPGRYETIAMVAASSRHSLSLTAEGKADIVIGRLRAEAAKLGANGLVLEDISDDAAAAFGAEVTPDVTRAHASLGMGLDATGLLASRYGRGVAIYIARQEAVR